MTLESDLESLQSFIQNIYNLYGDLSAVNNDETPSYEFVDGIVNDGEYLINALNECSLSLYNHYYYILQRNENQIGHFITDIRKVIDEIVGLIKRWVDTLRAQYQFTNERKSVGRPKSKISRDQLNSLLSIGFTWKKIASMLGVSERTLRNRRAEFQENEIAKYTHITDEELCTIVREIMESSPNAGERMVKGALVARGFRVQRDRMRNAMDVVNPDRNTLAKKIRRRVYSVRGPNALWHADGNHKLIRWRFVIHGGIDGFSRMIVFLKCVTNNRADTVLGHFLEAVNRFRCPEKIRTDYGTENIQMARWMIDHHGIEKRPVLTGLSVHNQRIERLWVDLKTYVTQYYIDLFYHLEAAGIIESDNEMHLFALHVIYIERINRMLVEFMESWNNHPLRTEKNKSPLQIWSEGFYVMPTSIDSTAIIEDDFYGVEEYLTAEEIETNNNVQVPESDFILSDEQLMYISNNFRGIDDGNHGIDTLCNLIRYLQSI